MALYVDHFEACGIDLFKAACDNDLERIVAKLAAGRSEPAATTWVKIKSLHECMASSRFQAGRPPTGGAAKKRKDHV